MTESSLSSFRSRLKSSFLSRFLRQQKFWFNCIVTRSSWSKMASFILDTPFLRLRVLCVRSWELSRSTQRKSDWMLQQFDSVFKCCCERVVTGRVEKLWSIRLQTSSPSSAVRGRPNITSTQMDILRIYKRHYALKSFPHFSLPFLFFDFSF